MKNNKGFAVSSVLYTLLVAFLLFLGAAMAQIASSSTLIGKSNDDIINSSQLDVKQVLGSGTCESGKSFYNSDTIFKINSRFGSTKYWPKDFYEYETTSGVLGHEKSYDNKIGVVCSKDSSTWESCNGYNISEWNVTACDGVTISGRCVSASEVATIRSKIDALNSQIYPENALKKQYTNVENVLNMSNCGQQVMCVQNAKKYFSIPITGDLKTLIDDNLYPRTCDNDVKTYFFSNNDTSKRISEFMIGNCADGFDTSILANESTNPWIRDVYNQLLNDYKIADGYSPVLFVDETFLFAYSPLSNKIYFSGAENMNYNEFNIGPSSGDTHFYIKVYDALTANKHSSAGANVVIKGVYNLCD